MAGLIFEVDPNYKAQGENGQEVASPYLVTAQGTFSLSGAEITVVRQLADGGTENIMIPVPTEAQLQAIYDSNPAFAKYISPPDDHVAPWQS